MASANVEKHTMSGTSAIARHNFRENRTNSNEHIDPSKSHLNVNLDTRYSSSREVQAAIKNRVKEVDAILPPKRKKKDRVTNLCIEIPVPRINMSYEDSVRFLTAAHKAIVEKYGEENAHGAWIHADEVHGYIDPVKKKMVKSRIHLHQNLVPYKEGKGVNGKEFCNRTFLRDLNKLLNEVCMKEFGFEFNDGSKTKSKALVEDLKAESIKAAIETNKIVRTKNEELTKENTLLENKKEELSKEVENIECHVAELEDRSYKASKEFNENYKKNKLLREENKILENQIVEISRLKELCNLIEQNPPKTYKTNLTGKFVQVPVEDLEIIQKIPQYAQATKEHLDKATKTYQEARDLGLQVQSQYDYATRLEEAHRGYDEKLANLDSHIEKEATRIAKKEVYEVLGNRVDQDQALTSFFKEKGLWASFQQFSHNLAKQIIPTKPRVRDRDDGRDI